MFINSVSDIIVTKVIAQNRLLNSPVGITTARKNREQWALVLKLGGKTYYTGKNGKQVISDRLHPVILPKGCSYSWKCVEPGECMILEFDAEQRSTDPFSFEITDNSVITNTFSKIEKSLYGHRSYHQLECRHLLYGIFLFLEKSTAKDYTSSEKRERLRPAVDYITNRYYDGSITNELLANLCGVSTVYFRKTFETVYGISPIKYLHNFRISKAKAILKSDFESITQVSESVGYNSIYHFSKMFKHYMGKSPAEYAKAFRG